MRGRKEQREGTLFGKFDCPYLTDYHVPVQSSSICHHRLDNWSKLDELAKTINRYCVEVEPFSMLHFL